MVKVTMSRTFARRKRQSNRTKKVSNTDLVAAPKPRIKVVQPLGGTYRAAGSEILGSYAAPAMGAKMVGILVAPATLGPRVRHMGLAFEKYRINRLAFELTFAGSAVEGMSLISAFDADAGDADPGTATEMGSWAHSAVCSFNDGLVHVMTLSINQPDDGYYTSFDPNGDYRLSYAGQYYVYCLARTATCSITTTVRVLYDITFFEPQLENVPIAPSTSMNYTTALPRSMFGGVVGRPSTAASSAFENSTTTAVWDPTGTGNAVQHLIPRLVDYELGLGGAPPSLEFSTGTHRITLAYQPKTAGATNVGFTNGTLQYLTGPESVPTITGHAEELVTLTAGGGNTYSLMTEVVHIPFGVRARYHPNYTGAYAETSDPDIWMCIDSTSAY